MVATPAVVGVEPPETGMLNVEVPGTVGVVPGAVVGETDPCMEEGKKCLEENQVGGRGRNYIKYSLNQNPSKFLVEIDGVIL